jgi:hypothetical protein
MMQPLSRIIRSSPLTEIKRCDETGWRRIGDGAPNQRAASDRVSLTIDIDFPAAGDDLGGNRLAHANIR